MIKNPPYISHMFYLVYDWEISILFTFVCQVLKREDIGSANWKRSIEKNALDASQRKIAVFLRVVEML